MQLMLIICLIQLKDCLPKIATLMANVNLPGVRFKESLKYINTNLNYIIDTRKGSIMFNEPKAVRLAFHDCMPYEDGGGCDGCLNFEANEDEHNVLQHTVAILV